MIWTDEQRAAIETRGSLIVSAAAGAGKTAVLTERVVNAVLGGTPVSELLVMTFTRAAAAEMKARIRSRIAALAERETDSTRRAYLTQQARAVDGAQISTIHAFCARVLKRHAHVLGLPPGTRVMDDMMLSALTEQVKDELLTSLAAADDTDWHRLLRAFGGEEAAWSAVTEAYAFIASQPDPLGWLGEAAARYDGEAGCEALLADTVRDVKDELRLLVDAETRLRDTLPPEMSGAIGALDDDCTKYRGLCLLDTFDLLRTGLRTLEYTRLSFPRGMAEEEKTPVKTLRELSKKRAKALCAMMPRAEADECAALRDAGLVLSSLEHVVRAFDAAFAAEKRTRAAMDYTDLEHLTLAALSVPEIAEEYRARFACVFVDEYQDINRVQEAILGFVRRADNVFLVGDVKQSIYRFRQAEPTLFLQKLKAFSGGGGTRIDLTNNFRSAPEVLASVNDTFAALMSEQAGEMVYDERARLVPGANARHGGAELHIVSREGADTGDELEAATDAEVEARLAAGRILDMMRNERYYDPVLACERPYRFEDFAILLRGTTHMQRIAQTLSQCGVPCYAQASGGYFDALEVQTLLDLLRAIDNRRQDVPLLSSMRGAAGDFSTEELLRIRAACPKGTFFDAVRAAAETGVPEDAALTGKVRTFLEKLDRYRAESRYLTVEQMIGLLLDETGLYEETGAAEGGAQRQANLDALLDKARAFERAGGRGIWSFLRHMALAEKNASFGAAQTAAADVVHLLTIHKSKGLEYPVVFLLQMGARFNASDDGKPLQLHAACGAGVSYLTENGRVRRDTAVRMRIARVKRREQRSEELRVLYVGMTRAKKKLILVGCTADPEGKLAAAPREPSPLAVLEAGAPLQWVMMGDRAPLPVTLHRRSAYLYGGEEAALPVLPQPSGEAFEAVRARFAWAYPHLAAAALPAKTTVSAAAGGDTSLPTFGAPAFVEAERSAAAFGTAMHAALQYLPLDRLQPEATDTYLDGLLRTGRISPAQAEMIDRKMLTGFLASPLYARMCASSRVERELPFALETPAETLFPIDADERIMLQGVIDCCMLENGAWTLLDYKTDRIPQGGTPEATAARHAAQTALYADALEKLSGIPVQERCIVLLRENCSVKV